MLNLDTHIFLNAVSGRLTDSERRVLASDEWGISDIVLWEIEMLHMRGRIGQGLEHPALAEALRRVTIWPLTVAICMKLRTLDFHSDPADEIIAATSLAYDVPLVTRDRRIRESKQLRFAIRAN